MIRATFIIAQCVLVVLGVLVLGGPVLFLMAVPCAWCVARAGIQDREDCDNVGVPSGRRNAAVHSGRGARQF